MCGRAVTMMGQSKNVLPVRLRSTGGVPGTRAEAGSDVIACLCRSTSPSLGTKYMDII